MKLTNKQLVRLLQVARARLLATYNDKEWSQKKQKIAASIEAVFSSLSDKDAAAAIARLPGTTAEAKTAPLPHWLELGLAAEGLRSWLEANGPPGDLHPLARDWLAREPAATRKAFIAAAVQYGLGIADHGDRTRLEESFNRYRKEHAMSEFIIDLRGTPLGFDPAAYKATVEDKLSKVFGVDKTGNENIYAYIEGSLINKGYTDTGSQDFLNAMDDARKETLRPVNPSTNTFKDLLAAVLKAIEAQPDRGAAAKISVQEYAFATAYVFGMINEIPIGHHNFANQVRIGLDRYVAGAPPSDLLQLPPLTGDGGTDVEIEGPNVQAVGLIYAAYQCERMFMFRVVDRITALFMQGLIPIGFDNAGRALDTYYWDSEDRLREADRMMIYSRVLGAAGGEVSKEVGPNKEFEPSLMRFFSSLAEYDRQQRVADLFDGRSGRSLALTGEQVRKAGRDLGANASLRGWAGNQFVARRLSAHIQISLNILKEPAILKAYGVTNPYQVIERVASAEFGQTPNIVKYRTMADAGFTILRLIGKYALTWAGTSGKPLFPDRADARVRADIEDPNDLQALFQQTQYYLAVNGIGDTEIAKMSQPVDTIYSPSIPALGPQSNGAGSTAAVDKIRQMVQAGTTPTLDQLQQLLPAFRA